MGKGDKYISLEEEFGIGAFNPLNPRTALGESQMSNYSLEQEFGLGKFGSYLADQTTKPVEPSRLDPSASLKNATQEPTEEGDLSNPINFLKRLKQGILDPLAQSEAFRPVRQSLDLIN